MEAMAQGAKSSKAGRMHCVYTDDGIQRQLKKFGGATAAMVATHGDTTTTDDDNQGRDEDEDVNEECGGKEAEDKWRGGN